MIEKRFRVKGCYICDHGNGIATTSIEIEHADDETDIDGYPFGSRSFVETRKKIEKIFPQNDEVKETRPLNVGSIKNNTLRRILMPLWFPFLLVLCIIGNILIGSQWIIKTLFSRITYLCVDFKKCWITAKE